MLTQVRGWAEGHLVRASKARARPACGGHSQNRQSPAAEPRARCVPEGQ